MFGGGGGWAAVVDGEVEAQPKFLSKAAFKPQGY